LHTVAQFLYARGRPDAVRTRWNGERNTEREEYRQTLRKALAENRERVVAIPWKAGSGMVKGKDRGVLFCAEVGEIAA
jgi:hypothetical protein